MAAELSTTLPFVNPRARAFWHPEPDWICGAPLYQASPQPLSLHLRSCFQEGRTAGPSATSGFPVRFGGFGDPHAAFLKESRIRGRS